MIKKPTGTLYLSEFDGIFDFDGGEIPSLKYTLQTEVIYDCEILDSETIKTSVANNFKQGEDVFIKYDGFEKKNRISIVGDENKLLLSSRLIPKTGSCKVRRQLKRIVLNNLTEGKYYIAPSNELLIIRRSWNNPKISYSEITTAFVDVKNLPEEELELLNDLAISQLYGKLEGLDGLHDALFADEFRMLVVLNMLAVLSSRFTNVDPEKNFRKIYDDAVLNFNIKYKKSENLKGEIINSGVISEDIPNFIGF